MIFDFINSFAPYMFFNPGKWWHFNLGKNSYIQWQKFAEKFKFLGKSILESNYLTHEEKKLLAESYGKCHDMCLIISTHEFTKRF